ncbi:MAG: DUF5684 domain-containing protein [Candidatus Geothermincolia bacterium]
MIHTTTGYLIYGAIGLIVYLYTAYCLRAIARKQGYAHPWFAWVPFLDVYLFCRLVIKHATWAVLWTVLCIVPFVGFIFVAIICVKLSRSLHRNRWYGLLLFVPLVNYVVLWDLAFGLRGTWQAASVDG